MTYNFTVIYYGREKSKNENWNIILEAIGDNLRHDGCVVQFSIISYTHILPQCGLSSSDYLSGTTGPIATNSGGSSSTEDGDLTSTLWRQTENQF